MLWLLSCAGPGNGHSFPDDESSTSSGSCPEKATAPKILPSVKPQHLTATYWIEQYQRTEDIDRPLLSVQDIELYNEAVGRRKGEQEVSQNDLSVEANQEFLYKELKTRLSHMHQRITSKKLVSENAEGLTDEVLRAFLYNEIDINFQPRLHVAVKPILIRCGPFNQGLYLSADDLTYDRNACSTVKQQEVIQILSPWPNGMLFVRTRYALGWIPSDAPLSQQIPEALQDSFVHGKRYRSTTDTWVTVKNGKKYKIPKGISVVQASNDDNRILLAAHQGFYTFPRKPSLQSTHRPLTRRQLLKTAFEFLNQPYSYGGSNGGRDCSRYLLDLFETFDIALPRHSGWQAQGGSYIIDVDQAAEKEKLNALDLAAKKGVVLLYFPGHIMLYLGRSAEGIPMAIHSLGEYVKPCKGQKDAEDETVIHVQRVVVSDLELGRDSSRRSFIERITRLIVFGKEADSRLRDIAKPRMAADPIPPDEDRDCKDSLDIRIFYSPRYPKEEEAVRVIAASSQRLGPAALRIFDPDLNPVDADVHTLGGPPFGFWSRIDAPKPGRWTAVLGDGSHYYACKRFTVRPKRNRKPEEEIFEGIWKPRWTWERDTINLWALFIEQLFDFPADDPRTWNNLRTLLVDTERNLLYNHLGLDEDEKLSLQPDCADLPYTLRAYFSWKLRLPFAFRRCSRGQQGRPPACGVPITNLEEREFNDEVDNFYRFVTRKVGSGVHSSSGRTHPEDDNTDLYPVGLKRVSLTPGTVYADPYGHIMIIAKWFPQQPNQENGYGVLMAAEAQPDGTIGRRRFWRGSFLFEPKTDDVGAGFKHFRPISYDRKTSEITPFTNEELAKSEQFPPFDLQQYRGSRDDFYNRMDALINPHPLDPKNRLISLIDALDESMKRRVIAVDNGERYMADTNYATIEMPNGHAIFETTGPWEDYSTPSRDMRLLISIDTVIGFPDRVAKHPERFSINTENQVGQVVDMLKTLLRKELESRNITYKRSDGSEQKLSFQEIIDRLSALEMAYNPNDCIEVRWGAPKNSDEASACKRRANRSQQARMVRYREWFRTRTRPSRDTVR